MSNYFDTHRKMVEINKQVFTAHTIDKNIAKNVRTFLEEFVRIFHYISVKLVNMTRGIRCTDGRRDDGRIKIIGYVK